VTRPALIKLHQDLDEDLKKEQQQMAETTTIGTEKTMEIKEFQLIKSADEVFPLIIRRSR
jgi:hypothetical protein